MGCSRRAARYGGGRAGSHAKTQRRKGGQADLLVEDLVIVELKSIEVVRPVHKKQLLTCLRLSHRRLGLLIDFGAPLIKDGITRVVNGLDR